MESRQRRLQKENRRLRRENKVMRRRLQALEPDVLPQNAEARSLALQNAMPARAHSYADYLRRSIAAGRALRWLNRTSFFMRTFSLLSKIWRWIGVLLAVLGLGAEALLTLAVFLPAATAASVVFLLTGALSGRRGWRTLAPLLTGKTVFLLFSPRRKEGAYFSAMIRDLRERGTVLVVSRTPFAPSFSFVGANLYRISARTYFFFRKHQAESAPRRVILIL